MPVLEAGALGAEEAAYGSLLTAAGRLSGSENEEELDPVSGSLGKSLGGLIWENRHGTRVVLNMNGIDHKERST